MNNSELKHVWLNHFGINDEHGTEWEIIERKYSSGGRKYHTLQHLADMYLHLSNYYQNQIPVTTLLALFYHDFEYNTLRNDNEKMSASYAREKLLEWNYPADLIDKVAVIILLTAAHNGDETDTEIQVFLDADMAILGTDAATYKSYADKVREEFRIYPDFMYKRGRKGFLQKTLAQFRIYQTEFFYLQFEKQARINIQNELNKMK